MRQADYLKSAGWTGKRAGGKVLYTRPLIHGSYTIEEAVKIQLERDEQRKAARTSPKK